MAEGFLGTPASLMLDIVVISLILVVPTMLLSIYIVKKLKNYALHRIIQLTLGAVLAVVVALFEIDMRLQGGFEELAKDSAYFDTHFLWVLLGIHLSFAVSTVFLWATTIVLALKRFPNPPRPGAFSPTHKVMAWFAVADMVATAVTGLMVYYFGFMS